MPAPSGTERRGLREQGVGLGECGYRSQPIEQRSGLVEDRRSFVRLAEVDEAAAVALEGVGVFGDDAEPFPALCGVGVAVGGGLVVAACFGEGGVGGDQGVVGVRRVGLVVHGEALGDTALAESERRPYECREVGREIGVVADTWRRCEFAEKCGCVLDVSDACVGNRG